MSVETGSFFLFAVSWRLLLVQVSLGERKWHWNLGSDPQFLLRIETVLTLKDCTNPSCSMELMNYVMKLHLIYKIDDLFLTLLETLARIKYSYCNKSVLISALLFTLLL